MPCPHFADTVWHAAMVSTPQGQEYDSCNNLCTSFHQCEYINIVTGYGIQLSKSCTYKGAKCNIYQKEDLEGRMASNEKIHSD